ncbi:DeoR/GlpR family DNA-binding transcription regulator [Arthrobacter castelli]|uniref:DeoR/GlpR family DNA-binding transcription regulator n=1 Tax=Arthrobacter castelli TaxID=271431 RepID=UPI000405C8A2|nr:DeoR/GlpR family DNA-binding transcription regulator [Arthrobacter castelli]
MLVPERHRYILRELEQREAVRVGELAAAMAVSEMTVRRDIETLHVAGSLRKVHGGAVRIQPLAAVEPGFQLNLDRETEAKTAIAGAAARLVADGMTVSLTGGSTTYRLAARLTGVENLTVVTNSIKVADVLHTDSSATVILTGGERTPSEALVGPVATAAISNLHVDLCFMGVHGLDVEHGLSTPNVHEAETNRAFAASAAELVVLADHTKFGVTALAGIVPLHDVGTLVTDHLPTGAAAENYSHGVGRVVTTTGAGTAEHGTETA